MFDVKSYVWSIKKFTLRWRYFFDLLRSSFKLRMTSTFFWYVNKSRWRAHHWEYCPQNMDKKVSSFSLLESWTLLSTISHYFSLEEKRLFFRRRNLKIIFFLVFLTPYALFFFSITTHIPIQWVKKIPPSSSPCD